MAQDNTNLNPNQERNFASDRPKTFREFKQAIEKSSSAIWEHAAFLGSFIRDVQFLNESRLEVLDGLAPLSDPKQEKIRVLIRQLQDLMFSRVNDKGWTLLDAADEFQDDFRKELVYAVEGEARRWDRASGSVLRLLIKSIVQGVTDEGSKRSLAAILKILANNAAPEEKAIVDDVIHELYMASTAANSIGLVGFVDEAETLIAELAAITGVGASDDGDEETAESDAEFFEANTEIAVGTTQG